MRNLVPRFLLALVVGTAAVTGCGTLDPNQSPDGGGTGTGGGGSGGGGGGGGGSPICGGIAGLACDANQFCEFPLGVCSSIADATGICRRPPQACTDIYQPVCGCDNRTYGNDCDRQGAGVSKLHDGVCGNGGEGAVCGGLAGFPCDRGLFCEEEPGVCHIIADGTGICRPEPQLCTREYAPVCGCDGVTYNNDCARAAAGQSKVHDGPC